MSQPKLARDLGRRLVAAQLAAAALAAVAAGWLFRPNPVPASTDPSRPESEVAP